MLNRMGCRVVVPFREALALAGYVSVSTGTAGGADAETGEAAADGNFTNDPVEPTYLIDIPGGTCLIPLEVSVAFEVIEDANAQIAIMSDEIMRYSSGGVAAVVARGIKTNSSPGPATQIVYSGDSAITATAAQAERIHYQWLTWDDTQAAEGQNYPVIFWKPAVLPFLVGPASFLIYAHGSNAGPEVRISVTWAELPTTFVQ
jgi:hypothetical protein